MAAPLSAVAGTNITVTQTGATQNGIVNIAECKGTAASNLTFSWVTSSTASTYGLWASNEPFSGSGTSGCSSQETSGSTTVAIATGIATVSGTTVVYPASGTYPSSQLMDQVGLGPTCSGTATAVYLCVEYDTSSGTTNGVTDQVPVDFVVPSAPTGVVANPGDSVLHVSWDQDINASDYGYIVYWGPTGTAIGAMSMHVLTGVGSTSYDVTGLVNGTAYDVEVAILSPGQNPGTPSAVITTSPVPVNDFWRLYRLDGGAEAGAAPPGRAGSLRSSPSSLSPFAAAEARVRRALLALAVALAALPAAAEGPPPPWGSFQLSVGEYRPNIDSELPATKPYQTVFGNGQNLAFKVDAAKSFDFGFGGVDLGLGLGYWAKTGKGLLLNGSPRRRHLAPHHSAPALGHLPVRCARRALQDPARALRAGLAGAMVVVDHERHRQRRQREWQVGDEGRPGWSYGAGLAFLLDFLDPQLAREMTRESGIRHTYIFLELDKSSMNDFGSSKSWDLSSDRWDFSGGLLFAF